MVAGRKREGEAVLLSLLPHPDRTNPPTPGKPFFSILSTQEPSSQPQLCLSPPSLSSAAPTKYYKEDFLKFEYLLSHCLTKTWRSEFRFPSFFSRLYPGIHTKLIFFLFWEKGQIAKEGPFLLYFLVRRGEEEGCTICSSLRPTATLLSNHPNVFIVPPPLCVRRSWLPVKNAREKEERVTNSEIKARIFLLSVC